jgi:transposase
MARQYHSLSTPQKSRIRQDLDDGRGVRATARKWKLSHSSVIHIHDSTTDRTLKPPGRPQLLDQNTLDAMKRYIDLNWHTACKPWHELLRDFGLSCSVQTLRRALHREGYGRYIAARAPLRTRKQKQRRFEWAAQHKQDDWRKILWSDECTFEFDLRVKQRVLQ